MTVCTALLSILDLKPTSPTTTPRVEYTAVVIKKNADHDKDTMSQIDVDSRKKIGLNEIMADEDKINAFMKYLSRELSATLYIIN